MRAVFRVQIHSELTLEAMVQRNFAVKGKFLFFLVVVEKGIKGKGVNGIISFKPFFVCVCVCAWVAGEFLPGRAKRGN